MGYYFRTFCASAEIPTIERLFEEARTYDLEFKIGEENAGFDPKDPNWLQVSIVYQEGKSSLLLERERHDGTEDCLAAEEIQEFLEEVSELRPTAKTKRVVKHLEDTKAIISTQTGGDLDPADMAAHGVIHGFFIDRCAGLTHADGEGFFADGKLLLRVG